MFQDDSNFPLKYLGILLAVGLRPTCVGIKWGHVMRCPYSWSDHLFVSMVFVNKQLIGRNMLLSLRSDHKEHLQLLTGQSAQVVVDFCKLAIDFLHNGPNNKLYSSAANKLNIDVESIQNCIYGLVNLLLISCKHKLSEADFRDSILTIGFTSDQQDILFEFYKSKCKEISEILRKLAVQEPHYHNLDWRFEVMVSSRSLLHQATPLITMDLNLKGTSGSNEEELKHVLLQMDPLNLLHMADELEKALVESRSRYSRRIQRAFTD